MIHIIDKRNCLRPALKNRWALLIYSCKMSVKKAFGYFELEACVEDPDESKTSFIRCAEQHTGLPFDPAKLAREIDWERVNGILERERGRCLRIIYDWAGSDKMCCFAK